MSAADGWLKLNFATCVICQSRSLDFRYYSGVVVSITSLRRGSLWRSIYFEVCASNQNTEPSTPQPTLRSPVHTCRSWVIFPTMALSVSQLTIRPAQLYLKPRHKIVALSVRSASGWCGRGWVALVEIGMAELGSNSSARAHNPAPGRY